MPPRRRLLAQYRRVYYSTYLPHVHSAALALEAKLESQDKGDAGDAFLVTLTLPEVLLNQVEPGQRHTFNDDAKRHQPQGPGQRLR